MNWIFGFIQFLFLLSAAAHSVRYSHLIESVSCSGEWSECVAVTDCEAALSRLKTGQNPTICGWSSQIPLVCCPPIGENVLPKHEGGINDLSPRGCGKRILPVGNDGLVYPPPAALEGILAPGIEPRRSVREVTDNDKAAPTIGDQDFFLFAVGGTTSTVDWPWMVSILNGNGQRHLCGGTFIDDRHVISAAHCFAGRSLDPSLYKVKVGELDLNGENKAHDVMEIKLHEGYRRRYYYDDIAIIRLAASLTDVTPACLPAYDDMQHGDNVTVLGWGDLSYGGPSTSKLQEVLNIPIVETSQCDAKFRTLPGSPFPRGITDTFLCAGLEEGGKDACQGDSGGPLLHEHSKGYWTLVGVVSFGYKCGEPGYPGVYTKISAYIPWIEKYIVNQNEVLRGRARSRQFEYIDGKPVWKSQTEKVQFPR